MSIGVAPHLGALVDAVQSLPSPADNRERIDRLRMLEELKSAACAAQMQLAVEFDAEVRDGERAVGVQPARRGRGVASQLGLALRRSPHSAQRWLWHAKTLTADLPLTSTELAAGRTTEWRALLVAKETSVLSPEDRLRVDGQIAPALEQLGDRQVEGRTRALARRLDPHAAVERARRAAGERCVSIRPVADSMCRLSILAPLTQGVAAYAALCRTADAATADGAPRGRGQLMADTAIARLTGQVRAEDVPVTVNLVMSVDTLLARKGESGRGGPALLAGPRGSGVASLPAGIARELALTGSAPRWLRRLFTAPSSDRLVQMETSRRLFTEAQRQFVALRDQTCRTPWCNAAVRHIDHVHPHERGGPTRIDNAQGLCVACNHAKQAPGWTAESARDGTVTAGTPTGHRYTSAEPRPPGPSPLRTRVTGVVDFVHPIGDAA